VPSFGELARAAFQFSGPKGATALESLTAESSASAAELVTKSARTVGPFAKTSYLSSGGRSTHRRSAEMLRRWADTNEWVRIAINRRKRQISQARWKIVRLDDPQRPPDPRVVDAIGSLLRFVNPKRESLRSLFDMVLEDLLVLDAGTIEKSKTLGGTITAIFAVDGATIVPDETWTGDVPRAIRYRQYVDSRLTASFRNDELVYMMNTPRSFSEIGWSPVESLARSIESDLYGDDYDYDMLRQTAPAGLLDIGSAPPKDVEAFREYYESELEGQRRVGIIGGAGVDAAGNPTERSATWINLQHSSKDLERQAYRTWIATKVAAAFELDLGVFNLTANLHKDTGGHQQALTDEGHRSLGRLVEEFFTREIVWEFDENHGFVLSDLNARDAMAQADLDAKSVAMGALVPNEIRAREGLEAVAWGDAPWIAGRGPWTGSSSLGTRPDDEASTESANLGDADAKPGSTIDDNPDRGSE